MRFDRALRSNFWLIPTLLLAIAAFLNARTITELVGVGFELDARELAQAPLAGSRPASAAPPARMASADAILARNPFDHVTGPLVAPVSSTDRTVGSTPLDMSDPWSAAPCEGIKVDVIAASDDVDWSFAAVSGFDKESHLVRRGGQVAGKAVYFIGWDRLWLSSANALCQAKLFGAKAPPPKLAAPVVSAQPPARPGPKPLDPELRKGIQAISATEFNIDRSVVDRILENQSELMRQARIIPVQENGRVVGVRLLGLRPDSLLGVLGMQNNDRLQTINGFEVANPEKALEAYARLRTADKLTVQVNRDGKNINLDYNIR